MLHGIQAFKDVKLSNIGRTSPRESASDQGRRSFIQEPGWWRFYGFDQWGDL